MQPIDTLLEGLLFYKATPLKKAVICKLLNITLEELATASVSLDARLQTGAIRLIQTETELQLATAPELAEFIDTLRKTELKSDIGKAGAETLAIILYREPISRAEIDRIRGVNSTFILRNLLMRGLVERATDSGPQHTYHITTELLGMLGVTKKHDLPQYGKILDALDTFAQQPSPETV